MVRYILLDCTGNFTVYFFILVGRVALERSHRGHVTTTAAAAAAAATAAAVPMCTKFSSRFNLLAEERKTGGNQVESSNFNESFFPAIKVTKDAGKKVLHEKYWLLDVQRLFVCSSLAPPHSLIMGRRAIKSLFSHLPWHVCSLLISSAGLS